MAAASLLAKAVEQEYATELVRELLVVLLTALWADLPSFNVQSVVRPYERRVELYTKEVRCRKGRMEFELYHDVPVQPKLARQLQLNRTLICAVKPHLIFHVQVVVNLLGLQTVDPIHLKERFVAAIVNCARYGYVFDDDPPQVLHLW